MLGSRDFVERLRALAGPVASDPPLREARQLAGLDPGVVLAAVTEYYGLESGALTRRHDRHIARLGGGLVVSASHRSDPERTGGPAGPVACATACRAWCDGWKRD